MLLSPARGLTTERQPLPTAPAPGRQQAVKSTGASLHRLGNLTLTAPSFLDFGTGAPGILSFGTYTPSALLTVGNFFQGNVLTFRQDLSDSIDNRSLFVFDNGFTATWNGSTFTITASAKMSAGSKTFRIVG